jgi:formylglycine-generating enzyme required for sulfatase activity
MKLKLSFITAVLLIGIFLTSCTSSVPIPQDMVLVKGGIVHIGTTKQVGDEEPVHRVKVSDFYIGQYEITQAEWTAVMDSNPSLYQAENHPVDTVTWFDAVEYCNKRSKKEGLKSCYTIKDKKVTCDFSADGYRLPTEAEWEYASRGGNKSKNYRYSGSNNPEEVAWYGENADGISHSVGSKKPNELELYDMSGNIWEWCWDYYDSSYYAKSIKDNPRGPEKGTLRVYRGGGSGGIFVWMRSAGRYSFPPTNKHWFIGFRVARNCTHRDMEAAKKNGMVLVEGGTFDMGSEEGQLGQKLTYSAEVGNFYMGKFEVTQEDWRAVMNFNPSSTRGAKSPVHCVNWYAAIDYCNKRSIKEGLTPCYSGEGESITCNFNADGYRLPTEAEWAYACKGGSLSKNYEYSGGNNVENVAWHFGNAGRIPRPVGQKKPNELGLYDMSGNVQEWCWNRFEYDNRNYGNNKNVPLKNPHGPKKGFNRTARGGSWAHPAQSQQTTFRFLYSPKREYSYIGFRVVRTAK